MKIIEGVKKLRLLNAYKIALLGKGEKPKATHNVLKLKEIKTCHGSLKVKALERKAGQPWFLPRQCRFFIFLNFPHNLRIFLFAAKKEKSLLLASC